MLNFVQGELLVKLARRTVERSLEKGRLELEETADKELNKPKGTFVTIHTYPAHALRGCIGFTAAMRLYEAVQRAAYAAAFNDPRFPSLRRDELDAVVFEVSVLTKPKLISVEHPKEYGERIEAGKDGLIIKHGPYSGLLLPQVWEQIPEVDKFLEALCWKAGLTKDSLSDKDVKLYRFRVQAFAESEPGGKVVEIEI